LNALPLYLKQTGSNNSVELNRNIDRAEYNFSLAVHTTISNKPVNKTAEVIKLLIATSSSE
jgi:hypothetical protein